MYSQTFPIAGTPRFLLPGSYLSAAGRVVMATGTIKRIIAEKDLAGGVVTVVAVYDGHDSAGATWRSTGRVKREVDITAAAALRQSVFECYGTGLTGGPAVSTYNKKAEFTVPSITDSLGEPVGGQVEIDCDILCLHGMLVHVTGSGNSTLTVVYEPRTLGRNYWKRAANPAEVF